jgi:polysaccharide biosynthesis transport protein
MEKVLLIDADMRRPSVSKAVGIDHSSNRPGLSNVIAGTATLDEAVYDYTEGNIHVLASGPVPPNPLELLGSKRFHNLLEDLREQYDRIIIDTAPSGAVSDAMALSKHADSMVYVVHADATPANQVANSIRRLREVDAHIAGVVLNKLNMNKNAAYYEQYYSGYYNYHAYGTNG